MFKAFIIFLVFFIVIENEESKAQTDLDYYSQAYDIIIQDKDTLKHLFSDTTMFNPDEVSICVSEISGQFVYLFSGERIVNELYPDSNDSFKDSLVNIFVQLDDLRMTEANTNNSEYKRVSNLSSISTTNVCNYLVFFTNISEGNVFIAEIYSLRDMSIYELEKVKTSYFNFEDALFCVFVIENGKVRKIYSGIKRT